MSEFSSLFVLLKRLKDRETRKKTPKFSHVARAFIKKNISIYERTKEAERELNGCGSASRRSDDDDDDIGAECLNMEIWK